MNTPLQRSVAGVVCAVLVGLTAACTGGASKPSAGSTQSMSTGSAATLAPKPTHLVVRVTRVAGKLAKSDQKSLEQNVGKAISGYFEAAFLGGDYPRSDFRDAFATFTNGAARKATRDRLLLTNAALGATTESVTPKKAVAYLAVLAPYKVAAGVTARIQLVYIANRGDRPAKRVELTGRLLLTRKKSGGWQIFGYDVARSATAATNGGS
jgi:hypothetical protein